MEALVAVYRDEFIDFAACQTYDSSVKIAAHHGWTASTVLGIAVYVGA